jgi:hypothetical protein
VHRFEREERTSTEKTHLEKKSTMSEKVGRLSLIFLLLCFVAYASAYSETPDRQSNEASDLFSKENVNQHQREQREGGLTGMLHNVQDAFKDAGLKPHDRSDERAYREAAYDKENDPHAHDSAQHDAEQQQHQGGKKGGVLGWFSTANKHPEEPVAEKAGRVTERAYLETTEVCMRMHVCTCVCVCVCVLPKKRFLFAGKHFHFFFSSLWFWNFGEKRAGLEINVCLKVCCGVCMYTVYVRVFVESLLLEFRENAKVLRSTCLKVC